MTSASILHRSARQPARMLDRVAPSELPAWIVEEAERIAGAPAGLYVSDIGGTRLIRLAGADNLPAELHIRSGIGAELPETAIAEIRAVASASVPEAVVLPLWLRGRATAVFIIDGPGGPVGALEHLAETAAPALELVDRYTDVVARARRCRAASPAAELQLDLLPPRLTPVAAGEVAASLLPAYDVGGDWFDYADNPGETWLTVADAVGRDIAAMGPAAVALGALRAARRSHLPLEGACLAMHKALRELGDTVFVTAVVGIWSAATGTFRWINCGHPPPLLIDPSGRCRELEGPVSEPLGLFEENRSFTAGQCPLRSGERLLLHSDGVTERRSPDGRFFGLAGIEGAAAFAPDISANGLVSAVERALVGFSEEPVRDDATQLALAIA